MIESGKMRFACGISGVLTAPVPARADATGMGSALIVVIWVIGILSVVISSFTFDAHIQARITSYMRKRDKAEYLARSGIEIAEMLMVKAAEIAKSGVDTEPEEEDRWYEYASSVGKSVPVRIEEPLGDGVVSVEILREGYLRNVNLLDEENIERILEVAGVPQDMWQGLVDCLLDWLDADDTTRQAGAESDWYATLDTPYRAKNGPLDTVEELLMVKGFSRVILEGGILETGFEDEVIQVTGIGKLLTVYGDGKVNVNGADRGVLMTLPGITGDLAGEIIREREGWYDKDGKPLNTFYESVDDFFGRFPMIDPRLRDLITTDSAIYRVKSEGDVEGVKRAIWCIAKFEGKSAVILQWREQE